MRSQRRPGPAGGYPAERRFRWGRAVLAIVRKEIVEVLRDRRTLAAAVLLPAVVMPLVVLAMPVLARLQEERLRDRPARIAVEGGDAGGLVAFGFDERAFTLVSVTEPRQALLRGEVDALLVDRGPSGEGPRVVAVLYDGTRAASRTAVQKVTQVAAAMALRDLRAAARRGGINPLQIIPVAVELENIASPQRTGGALLGTALPFFLAVWLLLGGQYAALDVGVGERERGSLEALLVAPPPRSAIIAGKFLAVLAPALLALVVMVSAGLASVRLGAPLISDRPVVVALTLPAAGGLLIVGMALGGLLSAVQLSISLAARTLREAQQAFTGLYLVVAVPVIFLPFLDEWAGRPWASLVPVANAALAFRAVLVGELGADALLATFGSLTILTFLALVWGVRILERQRRSNP
ncbi:MAG: ABC transporter permease subunit [Armatimonadota bacterium]